MTTAVAPRLALWESRLVFVVTAVLTVFGVAAVYGASSIVAAQRGDPGSYFALRQLLGAVLGGFGLVIAARLDYHVWQRWAWPLLFVAVGVLMVPYVPGIRGLAPELNGARRWIFLGPLSFQPSELAKFALVVWAAMLATKKGDQVRVFKQGVLPFLVITAPACALILFQPSLSTALLAALAVGVVLFTAGAKIGHFLILTLVAVPLVWHELTAVQYRLARMVSFLSPGPDETEASWQITQSLTGIGAGRLFGVGFGEGLQKLGYLPEAYTDFIFSTIGEEWGFLGVVLIITLFTIYIFMGFRIARTAPDRFGLLLVSGLVSLVGMTAVLHIAVTLAVIPTTGLPLPFLSYGRSSLVMSLIATGVIMNVARQRGTGVRAR